MKAKYIDLIQWLADNPNFSYWIVLFLALFVILLIIYLVVSNIRLHIHISSIVKDKSRLMEEKDLMRKGMQNTQEP
ncbi:MAG: hypothetical protein HQL32_00140 [Planctomycetes bacterium]|nr:hypothetical protein [Planctomycetota bacterium]